MRKLHVQSVMQYARDYAILQESNTNLDGGRDSGTKLGVTSLTTS